MRTNATARLTAAAGLAVALTSATALATDWVASAPGAWDNPANWSPAIVPNAVGASAVILADDAGGSLTSGGAFTFTSPITLGHLTIDIALQPYSTYFNSGTLTLDNGAGADVSVFTNGAYNVEIGGNIVLMGNMVADWRASNGQISGNISGDYGIITNSGYPAPAARLRLWGNNTYTGQTTAIKGDISIQSMAGLGDHSVGTRIESASSLLMEGQGTPTLSGEVVTLADGGSIMARPCDWAETIIIENLGQIGPWFDDYEVTVSGQITGTGDFVRRSAISQFTIDNTKEGILTLSNAANDYTGATIIRSGVLRVFDDGALGVAGTPITFDVFGFSEGPPALVTAADATIARDIAMLDAGWLRAEPGTTGTYSGVISGAVGLSIGFLDWTGTVALAAANTYTGATNVQVGTLLAMNSTGSATGTGNVIVQTGATVGGTGSISGSVSVAGGSVAPGASTGTLSVGSVTFDSASFFDVEIAGVLPGEFDSLNVAGAATLDGELNAGLINGYELQEGDSFTILTATTVSGVFATETLPTGLEVEYTPTSVILNAVAVAPACPADLNGDMTVDGADLATLLAAWGAAVSPADLNADGVVDGADLATMLAAWGACPV